MRKQHSKIIWWVAAGVLWIAGCSDSGSSNPMSGVGGGGTPSAPKADQLRAAYTASLTEAEIASDLQDIAQNGSFDVISGSMPDVMESFSAPMMLVKSAVSMSICQELSQDTAYTDEDGARIVVKASYTKGKNSAQVCFNLDSNTTDFMSMMVEAFKSLDGVSYQVLQTYELEGKYKTESQFKGSIDVVLEGNQIKALNMDMRGAVYAVEYQPKQFDLYADIDMVMTMKMFENTGMSDDSQTAMTGSMTMHFLGGRYQCVVNIQNASDDAINCDLTHNGQKVGSLSTNDEGDLVVRDASGNEIQLTETE